MSDEYRNPIRMAQETEEIEPFCALLQQEGVKSFLEIGSRYGGSLWKIANALPSGARIVSIDFPQAGLGSERSLAECVKALNAKGYDARLKLGDSTADEVIGFARALAPFDCIFIDADHTLAGVTADWNNYGSMANMVAFHDVAKVVRKPGKGPCEVRPLWDEIKPRYRHVEFISSQKGIGVLWRS